MSPFVKFAAAFRNPAARSALWLWRLTRWALGLVMLAWGLVLIAWATLHWAILPHIDDWRPAIERKASVALHAQLAIGNIVVRSAGWMPTLELRDVRVFDPQGREALRLPRVVATLSAQTLLTFDLRFEQLLLDSPELDVRRDAQGHIYVAGFGVDTAGNSPSGHGAADWFFAQHEFVIRKGRVRWTDESRQAPPLELADVDLVIRNGLRSHALRLDATPPPAWGQRFTLRGRFTQQLLRRAGELNHWSGQVYADLPSADVSQLRRHVDLPFDLVEGDGALRAWVDVKNGEATGATLDLGLRAVKLKLSSQTEALALAHIEGRLTLQAQGPNLSLAAHQLGFAGDDGLVWPRSDWGVTLRRRAGQGLLVDAAGLAGGELGAQQLDLALLAQIATRLPLSDEQRAWLGGLEPQGTVNDLSVIWDGPPEAPHTYRVRARVEGLGMAASETGAFTHPGLHGADLRIDASELGGELQFAVQNGELDLPRLFEERLLPLHKLSGTLDWRVTPQRGKPPTVEASLSHVQIANDDLTGDLDAQWHTGTGTGSSARLPGVLNLSAHIDRLTGARLARYLPISLPDTRRYLADALRSGEARDTLLKVQGDLNQFPFDGGRPGIFHIVTQARDVDLAYVPSHAATATEPAYASPWPAFQHVDAEVVIDRGSLQIRNGQAQVFGYELTGVEGGFKDMIHQPVLQIDGNGHGPAAELLRYVRGSPVSDLIGHGLDNASMGGNGNLKLSLQLPLTDLTRSAVKGQVLLTGGDVKLSPDVPLLAGAKVRIDFDQHGFQISGGTAHALGGDLSFEGGSQSDGNLRFTGAGVATAEGLRQATELGLPARVGALASGQAAYRLAVGIVHGQTELNINSTLQGLALDLPAPLHKDAEALLPLRVQTTLQSGSSGGSPLHDELHVDIGNQGNNPGFLLQALYQRDLAGANAANPRVLRGAIGVLDKLPALPEAGVVMQADLGTVDLDAWTAVMRRLAGGSGGSPAAAASVTPPAATAAVADNSDAYVPTQINLRGQNLTLFNRPLKQVVASISYAPSGRAWSAKLDSDQLSGLIEYRLPRAQQGAGTLYSRLTKLSVPKSEADNVNTLMSLGPDSVPALDIVADNFELRGRKLGHLEIAAHYSNAGGVHEWTLERLQIKHPEATLNASGHWHADPDPTYNRTTLDWQLDVSDAGQWLDQIGYGHLLSGGKGQLKGQIGWFGSPLSPDLASLGGQLQLDLKTGQFLKVDPGVGRLLGVLSLQSLPRRFLFDFRDVFDAGFAFDSVTGDINITKGVAHSGDLHMNGVQAKVAMEGSANLAGETQDLHVTVVPEINAGSASLAYAAINPAIGLGTFLAQLILRKPMMDAGTRQFHITGSWGEPKVDRVDDAPMVPAGPAASAGSAAASASGGSP